MRDEIGRYSSITPGCKLKYSSFKNYVLYESFRMGFGNSFQSFMNIWYDTLNMQYDVYGKIKEKYPKDLLLLHNQLSYTARVMRAEIDERHFEKRVKLSEKYEGEYKDYIFTTPKSKDDFLDEASQQNNCLAGYIKRFTEGEDFIIFMRKKKSPEKSYITIEVIDGRVQQARLARNEQPSVKDLEIVKEWIKKCEEKGSEIAA